MGKIVDLVGRVGGSRWDRRPRTRREPVSPTKKARTGEGARLETEADDQSWVFVSSAAAKVCSRATRSSGYKCCRTSAGRRDGVATQ